MFVGFLLLFLHNFTITYKYYSIRQVLNPLDAVCDRPRTDAICINQLKNAKVVDKGLLQERPDVKIFLPFKFLFYRPDELFQPHQYNRYLGMYTEGLIPHCKAVGLDFLKLLRRTILISFKVILPLGHLHNASSVFDIKNTRPGITIPKCYSGVLVTTA